MKQGCSSSLIGFEISRNLLPRLFTHTCISLQLSRLKMGKPGKARISPQLEAPNSRCTESIYIWRLILLSAQLRGSLRQQGSVLGMHWVWGRIRCQEEAEQGKPAPPKHVSPPGDVCLCFYRYLFVFFPDCFACH